MPPSASTIRPPSCAYARSAKVAVPAPSASTARSRTCRRDLMNGGEAYLNFSDGSHFRAHIDTHADAITWVVRQLSDLPAARVLVGHAIAFDAVLEVLVVPDLTTLRVVRALFGIHRPRVLAIAAFRRVVPDRRTDYGTCHRRGTAAIAAADLVADCGTDDAAENHRTGGTPARLIAAACRHVFVPRFRPALLPRSRDAHVVDDGVDIDHAGVVVLGTVVSRPMVVVGKRGLPGEEQSG